MSGRTPIGRRTWSRRRLGALLVAMAAVVLVPLALAGHFFGDVPNTNPHHDDITAIAQAGVTTGCGPGVYCPEQFVRRDQMASFMRRGFGRVAHGYFDVIDVPAEPSSPPGWTLGITSGLPPGALPGAAGFVKADAKVNVLLLDDAGCPCTFAAGLWLDGHGWMDGDDGFLTLTFPGEIGMITLTGAGEVDSSGAKTVRVIISGTGTAISNADVTAAYSPFGSAGGNVLGDGAAKGTRGALLERASELRR